MHQRIVEVYLETPCKNLTGDTDSEGHSPNPICKMKLVLYKRDEIGVIEEFKVAYNATVAVLGQFMTNTTT